MATPPSEPNIDGKKFPEAPWLGRFWQPLQPFLRALADALRGQLTISENMAGDVLSVSVSVDSGGVVTSDAVALKAGLRPRVVLVGGARDASGAPVVAPAIAWDTSTTDGGLSLKVTGATGLASGKRYTLTLAVFAG